MARLFAPTYEKWERLPDQRFIDHINRIEQSDDGVDFTDANGPYLPGGWPYGLNEVLALQERGFTCVPGVNVEILYRDGGNDGRTFSAPDADHEPIPLTEKEIEDIIAMRRLEKLVFKKLL